MVGRDLAVRTPAVSPRLSRRLTLRAPLRTLLPRSVARAAPALLAVLALVAVVATPVSGSQDPPAPAPVRPLPALAAPEGSDRLPEPEADPDQVRTRADDILSRAEYQEPPKSIIQRILEWIAEQLARSGGSLFGSGGGSVAAWVILLALIGVAAFLLTRLRRSGRFRAADEDDAVEIEVEMRRSVDEWGREAERFEAAGQWKEALRCRYRELIARLVDRDVVRDIPGRTTGEYRFEVGRNVPQVAGDFAGATELFDRAWYGDRPTGPDENAQFRELAQHVLAGTDRRVLEDVTA